MDYFTFSEITVPMVPQRRVFENWLGGSNLWDVFTYFPAELFFGF